MKKLGDIIKERQNPSRPKNLSREFQVYGVYLAETLGDTAHYSLYIKLAKNENRALLEEAMNFAKDYDTAKSKGKIFMWKFGELKKLKKLKN